MAAKNIVIEVGKVYGDWTIIGEPELRNGRKYYPCRCSCGKEQFVGRRYITSGTSSKCKSCAKTRHGHCRSVSGSRSPEYLSWTEMRKRCIGCSSGSNKNYAGRGITVCDRWIDSYDNFYEDMGPKPSPKHSIDRIDVNGNYCPENCRWATRIEQNRNRRNTKRYSYNGNLLTAIECSEITGIPAKTIEARIRYGWPVVDAIERPLRKW